jgi:uncharacterized protein (DUF305 family)
MFHKEHLLTLGKYIAIGFLSWAMSHGFFSWQRSVIMAILWLILFFVCERLSPQEKRNRGELILFILIFPLSIGMLSWWLQHFQDSPSRSLLIIPLGYFLSLLLFQRKSPHAQYSTKRVIVSWIVVSAILAAIIRALIHFLPSSAFSALSDHHGDHAENQASLPTKEDHIAMGHVMPEDQWTNPHADHAMMDHGEMVTDELSFIQLMIPHHQEAVDTTTTLLQTTPDESLQTLGKSIISAQQKEMSMMKQWLQDRYPTPWVDHSTKYMLMMRPTTGITEPKQLDTMRTTDMIVHHEGAVQMAEKILTLPTIRPEVKQFAETIIRVQKDEIAKMRNWLDVSVPSDETQSDHAGMNHH